LSDSSNPPFVSDNTCKIAKSCQILYPNHILNNSVIGEGVRLLPSNYIYNSNINNGCEIGFSVIKDSTIGEGCNIGPFTHIREKCVIHQNSRIGNFCEIKNSTIGAFTKISHHAYVGDSIIGENCNIGCGVIFANFDGIKKHTITIGNNVFVGCNCVLIAPLNIADNTYICANTTVTQDTSEGDFVIGRSRAVVKSGKGYNRYVPKR